MAVSKRFSVGRPPKFESAEEIEKLADEFFEECKINKEIPTMAGLALKLGTDRHTIINYGKKEEFFATS
jgi:hypothetical protein